MTPESIIAITLLATSALTSGFFAYMHSLRRQAYLMLWSAGWCLLALHYLSPALEPWTLVAPWQAAVNEWLLAAAALLFFSTAQVYTNTEPWVRPQIAAGGLFALWSAAFYLHQVKFSPQLGVAAVLAFTAWLFYQESRRHETFADLLLAASFLSWSAILIGELLLSSHIVNSLRALELLPQLFAAALMVMGLYEEEKRRVEQNMLALSNVNLATSSFIGPEIQQMLSQALERVLSVVRMPAGVLFLHHGHPKGPTSIVAVGLTENFLRRRPGRRSGRSSRGYGFAPGRHCGFPRSRARRFLDRFGRRGGFPAFPATCDQPKSAHGCRSACKPRNRRSAFCSSAPPTPGGLVRPSFACCWRWAIKSEWPSKIATSSSSPRVARKSCTC